MKAIVMVRVRCPYGHTFPVSAPDGTPIVLECRKCGRFFEVTVR